MHLTHNCSFSFGFVLFSLPYVARAALLCASWSDCSYLTHCAETADNIYQVLPLRK